MSCQGGTINRNSVADGDELDANNMEIKKDACHLRNKTFCLKEVEENRVKELKHDSTGSKSRNPCHIRKPGTLEDGELEFL